MAHGLFATKSVAELSATPDSTQQLRRTLSVVSLTAFGIGSIIGTGIFVLTGTAAANHAGPALALSFVLAGFGCALAALCYAEFAAMIPVSGSTVGQARIFMTMGADGLLPPWFARVHPKFKTPANGTLLTGLAAAVIGGLFPVRVLGELVSIGTLLAFITVCLGVLVLRKIRPELHRPFRVPWPRLTCTGGAVACTAMIIALPADTWIRLVVWTAIGLSIYAFYGYRMSRLRLNEVAVRAL